MTPANGTIADLIGARAFPAVVQAADIRTMRDAKNTSNARDFIGGYLGFDERSRHALDTSIASLSQSQKGGAFFLNGVFGSGKSHLLGLLALLTDRIGHEHFTSTHPHLAQSLNDFPPRLVVHFSLDDYSQSSLEEIVKTEIAREWQRRFDEKLTIPDADSRREYFANLDEQLLARGCKGLFVGIDELSLFLSGKEHSALQADAAFLQFIGQRAARSTPATTHIFAAIQKTVEDIGDLENYSLSQIRDRFQILPLSLAHIPSLVSHRLIIHKNPIALQGVCRESYEEIARALPRLDFGLSEWETLFPFHPATIALLENVVARFFSRTRSAAIFCDVAARRLIETNAPAQSRVLPGALFDYLLPELELHPELRSLAAVWSAWQSEIPILANDASEAQTLLRLMKTLLLWKIAGLAPTPIQLANGILLNANLPGDGNYEYARVLLERILAKGNHLAVERNESGNVNDGEDNQNPFADRYTIDSGTRVSELARRHLKNALSELRPDDARIAAHVLSCTQSEPLPLTSYSEERTLSIFWKHAPREVAVQVLTSTPNEETIANRAAMISSPGAREDLLILIAAPFSEIESENFSIQDPRIILWTPRAPTDDEKQIAREGAAAHLLQDDPQLLDNRRGRAILQFLKDESATRQTQIARLAGRLLHEGTLKSSEGRAIEASELASGQSWNNALEAISEWALAHIFPRFEIIAPRARVLTPGNADQLCLEVLRRPADEPYFAASLERIVRAVAAPLGIATTDKGRWKISGLHDDLKAEIKTFISERGADGRTLSILEAHFSKSDWGAKREQIFLAICALLRSSELVAHDAKGGALQAAQIGMPLSRSVRALRLGDLLDAASWVRLRNVVAVLTEEKLGALSFAEQERAHAILLRAREEMEAATELSQARVRQLQRALNHAPSQWPQVEKTLQSMANRLEELGKDRDGETLLRLACGLDSGALQETLIHWHELQNHLESRHAELLNIHRLLTQPSLSPPDELQRARLEILARLEIGEAILEDEKLLSDGEKWRLEYSRLYRDWHQTQHDAARWNSLRRLQSSDELRGLERLQYLTSRPFPHAAEIRNALVEELRKHCPREGTLLPGEAVCNACGLRFGERVSIRDAREIEAMGANAMSAFHQSLQEENARNYLMRQEGSTALLEWNGEGATLLPLLSDEMLERLNQAFKPRRRVARALEKLSADLKNCRTREEFESAFALWLDGGESLAGDDEIELR